MVRDLTRFAGAGAAVLPLLGRSGPKLHSPHQAPQAYLDKYRGRYDAGWDVVREQWFQRQKALGVIPADTQLAPRNPGVRPWAELSANEQRFACRLQEAFAAMLEHTDHQIGRLIDFLKSIDAWDNTLFMVMSDNGASQEGGATGVLDEMKWFNGVRESVDEAVLRLDDIGGPNSHCNIPWGWAQAGNTPLKWYKQNTHGGGVRDPLIMHWPNGLPAGETRGQFCHVIDISPTILDLLGIPQPEVVAGVPQMPVHGVSLKPTFADPAAPLERSPQYFEMLGHRGVWKDGWKAVTHHRPGKPFDEDRWELYHLAEDFSEYEDLAEREPAKLKEMIDLWWAEADTHGALPLDDRPAMALFRASMRPGLPSSRHRFVYYPPVSHIVADACPSAARGWTTSITLEHPQGAGDGALVVRGSLNSGFALYVKDGLLVFDYNYFHQHVRLTSASALPPGSHEVEADRCTAHRRRRRRHQPGGGRRGRGERPRAQAALHAVDHRHGPRPQPLAGHRRLHGPLHLPRPDRQGGVRDPAIHADRRGQGPGSGGDDPAVAGGARKNSADLLRSPSCESWTKL